MKVIELSSGEEFLIEVLPVEKRDYKNINKKRYFFDWKKESKYEVYKLRIEGTEDILGLISLEKIPEEWRIHIRLLTVSVENKGMNKVYENITGNLLAFAAIMAVREFAELACISLRPKTEITAHYIKKYNMSLTGVTLSLQMPEILDLINKYNVE